MSKHRHDFDGQGLCPCGADLLNSDAPINVAYAEIAALRAQVEALTRERDIQATRATLLEAGHEGDQQAVRWANESRVAAETLCAELARVAKAAEELSCRLNDYITREPDGVSWGRCEPPRVTLRAALSQLSPSAQRAVREAK